MLHSSIENRITKYNTNQNQILIAAIQQIGNMPILSARMSIEGNVNISYLVNISLYLYDLSSTCQRNLVA